MLSYIDKIRNKGIILKPEHELIINKVILANKPKIIINENLLDIVIAILAKDKAYCLEFYLECILNQTYPKKHIHLYIRTNDNNDNTEEILTNFINTHGNEYASVHFDKSNISQDLRNYKEHEWNKERFSILGKIRMDSVLFAKKLKAHYFVVDIDNFIIPTVLENLLKNKSYGVISPMLDCKLYDSNDKVTNLYSNYHFDIDAGGYYKDNNLYFDIKLRKIKGIIEVPVVHCTYFINYEILDKIQYSDSTTRHEYVIFSDNLRKNNISQYLDNRNWYGFLTITNSEEEYKKIFESWKDHMKYFSLKNM
jgi:hypothetical protein